LFHVVRLGDGDDGCSSRCTNMNAMSFHDNILVPVAAVVTSVFGWCTCVFVAATSAFWLGLSLGIDRFLSPMEALFVAIYSPLLIGRIPSLLVVYSAVAAACYFPVKWERWSYYLIAIVGLSMIILCHSWYFCDVAERALRVFEIIE
jgi:hypothetical protein